MQKHCPRRAILANARSRDFMAISRRFALLIELLGLMERLTTEFGRAGIDRQQQNSPISEREGETVPLAAGREVGISLIDVPEAFSANSSCVVAKGRAI